MFLRALRAVAGSTRARVRRPACLAAAAAAAVTSTVGMAHAMRIEEDVKLDYKDVLLRPKRSTLRSRSEVDLSRVFRFRHSGREWTGVPMIVANMDTVGTFSMAVQLAKHRCMVAMHKHYTVDEWKSFAAEHPDVCQFVAVSAGTSKSDMDKLDAILTACPEVTFICLDVANGYSCAASTLRNPCSPERMQPWFTFDVQTQIWQGVFCEGSQGRACAVASAHDHGR